MKIEPVSLYKTPAYPTIEQFVYNPHDFLRHAPHAWLGNAAVMTALLAFATGGSNGVYGQSIKPATEQTDKKPNKTDPSQQEQQPVSHIAPIFVHGDGTGSLGCIVVTPPVNISEAEALQIIENELAKHHLTLDSTNRSVQIPVKKIDWIDETYNLINEQSLEFDREIQPVNFLLEYVSYRDCLDFEDDDFEIKEMNGETGISQSWSSVSDYDTKQMANSIRETMLKENKHNAVVFYDPVVNVAWDGMKNVNDLLQAIEREPEKKQEARQLLIRQVTDFIEWLKKEKLLNEN